jgi:glycosyltransferase involved in cell wall biosynthesis
MGRTNLTAENTIFVILSFEGPDSYSLAGGLGVRVSNLSQALAKEGFTTHLFFVGDSHLKGEEITKNGKLILHRWCQWISAYYPLGVYQGENQKLHDYTESIPPYLLENIIKPASGENKVVVVMAEEWHTADTVCNLSDFLQKHNLKDKTIIFWNANNTFGFDNINFKALARACNITTVSRFMKHAMWRLGLNPLVIPNGIPRNLLSKVNASLSAKFRNALAANVILTKIARWDPDKRWNMALEATARLKARGLKTILIGRGGIEGYGQEVLYNARSLGLKVKDVTCEGEGMENRLQAMVDSSPGADVLNVKFFCSQELLKLLYHSSTAVLANSGREPFGLVGLETMASGGIAFTGSTGEDYAISFHNSIGLETSDPREIESYVMYLDNHPEDDEKIRKAARYTAARFTWEQIVENLIQRLEFQAKVQRLLTIPARIRPMERVPDDFFKTASREPILVPEVQTV